MKRIGVVILGDVPLLREGVRVSLEKPGDIEVLGEVCAGSDLAGEVTRQEPDVALVAMGDWRRSLAAVGEIAHSQSETAVMALLVQSNEQQAADLVEAGARGVVSWTTSGEELAHIIRMVASGKLVIDCGTGSSTVRNSHVTRPRHSSAEARDLLTDREMEVLRLAAGGMRNRELAVRLGLSEPTIKSHLASIFNKLGCRSRTEAAMLGIDNGWFSSPSGSPQSQAHAPTLLRASAVRRAEPLKPKIWNSVGSQVAVDKSYGIAITLRRHVDVSRAFLDNMECTPRVGQVWLGGPGRLFPVPADLHRYLEIGG